jgi:phospholipid transport system substrate-binding protein
MNRILQGISLALLLALTGLLIGYVSPAQAQTDPAAATVQNFYDVLIASMKAGGTAKSRYEKLKPAVEQAYDLTGSAAASVGPAWSGFSPADQKAVTDAFGRYTIANYARNFDSYGGEKFTVDPAVIQRGDDKLVKSSLKPGSGDAIPFNYRMHQVDGSWKIIDVYLNGTISQLAQKRSDFAKTLSTDGPQGLAKRLNALADQMLN